MLLNNPRHSPEEASKLRNRVQFCCLFGGGESSRIGLLSVRREGGARFEKGRRLLAWLVPSFKASPKLRGREEIIGAREDMQL